MPSPEQKRKIRTQFDIMSVPYYIVRVDDSRGARHGESQWQCDHWQAKDAKRRARKKGKDSIVPARSADLGKHSVYTQFPKDRNCEICQRTKITRARAEDALAESYLVQKILVT